MVRTLMPNGSAIRCCVSRIAQRSAGECLVAFESQAAGAVRLQCLPAEAFTTQHLADDADRLVPVDRLRRAGLSQGGVVRQKLVASTRAERKHLALRP